MTTTLRETLDSLLALQAVDSQRDAQSRSLKRLDSGAEASASAALAEKNATEAREALSQTKSSIKDAELELNTLETKIQQYEKRIKSGAVTNSKEIVNVEKEMAQLSKQRSAVDDKILALMETLDSTQLAVASTEAERIEKVAAKAAKLEEASVKRSELDTSIAALAKQRKEKAALVTDAALLARYETLRAKPANAGIAISKTLETTCGGCKMQVSSYDARKARSGEELIYCQNCGRIMA